MKTIDPEVLAAVAGGTQRGQSPAQVAQRRRELCQLPSPSVARSQYDWMVKHMVPDSSEAPGIKHRAVQNVAQTCGWPFPR